MDKTDNSATEFLVFWRIKVNKILLARALCGGRSTKVRWLAGAALASVASPNHRTSGLKFAVAPIAPVLINRPALNI